MKITQALQEYLLEIEIRKYTQKTIRSYRNNLNLFVRYRNEEAKIYDTEDISLAYVRMFSQYMVKRGKTGRYINSLPCHSSFDTVKCIQQGGSQGGADYHREFKEEKYPK